MSVFINVLCEWEYHCSIEVKCCLFLKDSPPPPSYLLYKMNNTVKWAYCPHLTLMFCLHNRNKGSNAKLIFLFYLPLFSLNPSLISPSALSIHMALSIHPCVNWAFILYLSDRGCIVCDGHSDLKKHLSATYLWVACGVELLSCISEWDSTFIGGYEENYNVSGTTGLLLPLPGLEYKLSD